MFAIDKRAPSPDRPRDDGNRADARRTNEEVAATIPSTIKLVGRTTELKELEKELRRASQGEFRCVLLSADPGIGKTRLTAELLARNRRRTIGLSARAYALGRMASFGLWAEALDRHLRDLPAEQVSSLCGGFLEDLAGLLRGVAAIHGSTPSHEVPRFRLFEALAVLIKNLAARAPLIIALDDLHDADGSSWEVLNYLAHNLPETRVLIVGAVRPAELSDQPIGIDVILGLEQEGMLRRLPLRPLSPEGVGELTELVLHDQAPSSLVAWLAERSRGNALFALSLLLALVDEGADLSAPSGPTLRHLPEGLAERVMSRMKTLEEPAVATLEVLAMLGRPVDPASLARLSDQPFERLGEILQGLVRTRLVTEEEQGRELSYGIVHPLVQEAIYQGICGARRRTLHRLAGRALLASGRAAEAAPHFARSADAGDEEAIDALRDAFREAERGEAYEEALTVLGALVELLPGGDPRWLDVLEALSSQAQWVVDDRAEIHAGQGIEVMRALDSVLETSFSPRLRANVKLRLATFLGWGRGEAGTAEADGLLEQAIELFDLVGDRQGALLAAHTLAWSCGIRRDWQGMVRQARQVADAARSEGVPVAEAQASLAVGLSCQVAGAFAAAEAALQRAVAIGREKGSAYLLTLSLAELAVTLGGEGRIRESFPLLRQAKSLYPEGRERFLVPMWESLLYWLVGDFPSALAGAEETLAAYATGVGKVQALGLSFAALAAAESDRLAEAQRYAAVARAAYRDGDWMGMATFSLWADAVLAWRAGKRIEALESPVSTALRHSRSTWAAFLLIDLAEMAAESDKADVAAEAGLALDEIARRLDRDLYRALSDLGSAWAGLATGSETDAGRRAERAASVFARLGYRALEGRALHVLGRSLAVANRKEAAVEISERAVEVFEACGAAWRVQRCREAMRRLGSPGRRAAAASLGPSSLSKREREVARLGIQGLTARQIGEQLFISARTVETHLTSVYAKLGVESKLDLMRHASELAVQLGQADGAWEPDATSPGSTPGSTPGLRTRARISRP
jgi:DNA-binding CsgD family transcriptional regulator